MSDGAAEGVSLGLLLGCCWAADLPRAHQSRCPNMLEYVLAHRIHKLVVIPGVI